MRKKISLIIISFVILMGSLTLHAQNEASKKELPSVTSEKIDEQTNDSDSGLSDTDNGVTESVSDTDIDTDSLDNVDENPGELIDADLVSDSDAGDEYDEAIDEVAPASLAATDKKEIAKLTTAAPSDSMDLPAREFKPFGRGAMDFGLGLGASGNGDYFSMSVGAYFAYFVLPGLAPGLDVQYNATWGDYIYPQSITLMPFLKYVFFRNVNFSPFILVGGGRDFEWGGTKIPEKGYVAADAWIFEAGVGVYVGLGKRMGLQIQLLAQYYNFDEKVDIVGDGTSKAVDSTWYFPVFNMGLSFYL